MDRVEPVAEVGDFRVLPCCADCLFLERISTIEGTDVPRVEVEQILQLPASEREAALQQCWDAHF